MTAGSKVWFWFVFALSFSEAFSKAATNEYYSSPAAKAVIDAMIQAYGGAEKLKAIDRVKVVAQVTTGSRTVRATFYQTATKMRRDAVSGPVNLIEIFDGKDVIAILNGKPVTPRPEAKPDLANEVKEGVFQAALLDVFMNKDRHVALREKKVFDGKNCDVIETKNYRDELREHFIDPESHREIGRITHKPQEKEMSVFEGFDEFQGVVYPARMVFKRADGSVSGGMRVVEISSDFDNSVFVPDLKK